MTTHNITRLEIHPPGGMTFQASNGAHTYLVCSPGSELQAIEALRRECDRLEHNARIQLGLPLADTAPPPAIQLGLPLGTMPKEEPGLGSHPAGLRATDAQANDVVVFAGAHTKSTPHCVVLVVDSSLVMMPPHGARTVANWLNKSADAVEKYGGSPADIVGSCWTMRDDGSYAKLIRDELGVIIEG